jgi:hypothetical protein
MTVIGIHIWLIGNLTWLTDIAYSGETIISFMSMFAQLASFPSPRRGPNATGEEENGNAFRCAKLGRGHNVLEWATFRAWIGPTLSLFANFG